MQGCLRQQPSAPAILQRHETAVAAVGIARIATLGVAARQPEQSQCHFCRLPVKKAPRFRCPSSGIGIDCLHKKCRRPGGPGVRLQGRSGGPSLAVQAQDAVQPPRPLLHAALGHAGDQPGQTRRGDTSTQMGFAAQGSIATRPAGSTPTAPVQAEWGCTAGRPHTHRPHHLQVAPAAPAAPPEAAAVAHPKLRLPHAVPLLKRLLAVCREWREGTGREGPKSGGMPRTA